MKIIFLLFFFNFVVNGQNYFPVNIGDKWEWYDNIDNSTYSEIITNIIELNDGSKDIYYNIRSYL